MRKDLYYDVVIAGCGVSGLYTAIHLPKKYRVLMICKEDLNTCDSMLAQGGICVMRNDEDYDAYYDDTMRAGHFENTEENVDIMVRSSRKIINHLLRLGVAFDKDENGELLYTKEGGHSKNRICFHKDITGKEITTTLRKHVEQLKNVTFMEYTTMKDILVEEHNCTGMIAENGRQECLHIHALHTVLATGGIGGLYERSTNYPCLVGDAITICKKHDVQLDHLDYVQIHPTSLYRKKENRSFLISESCRGDGAILLNHKGERFVNELLPRDIVSKTIYKEMEKEKSDYVWLSFENVAVKTILSHFPNIYMECLKEGFDITKQPIPVVPAQHYFMGGIHVDSHSSTTMKHLYAVGETSCNGVHGKNRLASNSLLESLVFAQRAAAAITASQKGGNIHESDYHAISC